MQNQGVCFEEVHQAPAFGEAVAIVELDGAQVGKQGNVRGDRPYRKSRRDFRLFDGHPLGADPHGQAIVLGHRCEALIDLLGLLGAARHGGNQQRDPEGFAQKRGPQIKVFAIDLRQATVGKPIAL